MPFNHESFNLVNLKEEDAPVQLTKLYIIALSVVAILSLVSQMIIQNALDTQMKDSYIVNMAGRQRMLSQKITKHCLDLERKYVKNGIDTIQVKELELSLAQWVQFHDGLYNRNPERGLGGENSEEINSMFAGIDPFHQNMVSQVDTFTNLLVTSQPIDEIEKRIELILFNERHFLKGMEEIVRQYEREATQRVAFIKKIEIILLVSVIIILLLEGLFIFRPAANKIKTTMASLKKARDNLRITNKTLEKRIHLRTKEIIDKNRLLQNKNLKLKEVNKDLDNFVYTASHDLKAPINNIEGLINALESYVPDIQNQAGDLLGMMHESIDRFKLILADLSDTGKARQEILGEKGIVKFEETCQEVLSSINSMIIEYDATILTDFAAAPQIRFSKKNIRSIFHNLISNALKYSSPKRKPLVKLVTIRSGDFILLRVSDNGLGIKQEDLNKVFSMYERIHTHVEGTGVGLSLLKKIVENSGGKVELRSKEGKGSVFCIFLKDSGPESQ